MAAGSTRWSAGEEAGFWIMIIAGFSAVALAVGGAVAGNVLLLASTAPCAALIAAGMTIWLHFRRERRETPPTPGS